MTLRPGDYVGTSILPLYGRIERIEPATGPYPHRAYVLPLRTQWCAETWDGVGQYLAWRPVRDLCKVDINHFLYCPLANRYYARPDHPLPARTGPDRKGPG